jgi:hypothetical protein
MRVSRTTLSLLLLTSLFWYLLYLSQISEYDQNYAYFAYAAILSVGTFVLHYRTAQMWKSDSPFGQFVWFATLFLGSPLTVVLFLCLRPVFA